MQISNTHEGNHQTKTEYCPAIYFLTQKTKEKKLKIKTYLLFNFCWIRHNNSGSGKQSQIRQDPDPHNWKIQCESNAEHFIIPVI